MLLLFSSVRTSVIRVRVERSLSAHKLVDHAVVDARERCVIKDCLYGGQQQQQRQKLKTQGGDCTGFGSTVISSLFL